MRKSDSTVPAGLKRREREPGSETAGLFSFLPPGEANSRTKLRYLDCLLWEFNHGGAETQSSLERNFSVTPCLWQIRSRRHAAVEAVDGAGLLVSSKR